MFTLRFTKVISLIATLFATTCTPATSQVKSVIGEIDTRALAKILAGPYTQLPQPLNVKSAVADGGVIRIKLSDNASMLMLTPRQMDAARDSVRLWCGKATADVKFYTQKDDLKSLLIKDDTPGGRPAQGSPVRRIDDGHDGALTGRNIALWPSHGRYYEPSLDRWEWQRGRLFTTVEDLLTPSIALPFLIPMLENAGATIYTPRERDTTRTAVIIDNTDKGYSATRQATMSTAGFGHYKSLGDRENPFTKGTAYVYEKMDATTDSIVFRGKTATSGPMMVYVAYTAISGGAPIGGAEVTVRHGDGEAHYRLDQRRGGGMWMPLGVLPFRQGREWSVTIKGDGTLSADAVRIGGGMGTVERGGETSGMPAWAEAARYYLQTDGFDYDKVLSVSNGAHEYTDDINARGEWVNALVNEKKIAIDLAFALHTDAFVTHCDSTIGTLALFTTSKNGQTTYPDGRSRATSRQLAGYVSASVLADIRRVWDRDWTFRGLADKRYAESRRPDVPALLLELMSHQNVADIRLGLHPAFRRDMARAIYKGIARYLCGPDVAITPLPPSHMEVRLSAADSVTVMWAATVDTLEPSATADRFAVYEGERMVGITRSTSITIHQPQDGVVRTYSVVAIGPGGRSMPSESLPACIWRGGRQALLVEGMDRLAGPDFIQCTEWAGAVPARDAGVPWPGDVYTVGDQYDYDQSHEWEDDDAPGCGASYSDMEMKALRGGATRSLGHSEVAKLMRMAGYTFTSQSKEAFDADTTAYGAKGFDLVRISLDRQRTTTYGDAGRRHSIYTPGFCRHVEAIKAGGSRIVISGRFVGTDATADSTRAWCANTLGFKPRSGHASRTLILKVKGKEPVARWMRENTLPPPTDAASWHQTVDAIEPASAAAKTVCRYADSLTSAAVEYGNILVTGF